jgi:hypothetical protein
MGSIEEAGRDLSPCGFEIRKLAERGGFEPPIEVLAPITV